jgi:hypothetical protein
METKSGKISKFCSLSCRSKFYANETNKKRLATNLEKYGVDNPSKSTQIIQQRAKSNLEKYGVSNPFQLKEIQEKQQETMVNRYGVSFASQCQELNLKRKTKWKSIYGSHPWGNSAVREKIKSTMIERYGVPAPILNQDIFEKIKKTCFEKYGHENPAKSKEVIEKIKKALNSKIVRDKIKKTCLERYGANTYGNSRIPKEIRTIIDNPDEFEILLNQYGIIGLSELLNISLDTVRNRAKQFGIVITYSSGLQAEIESYIRSLNVSSIETNLRKIIPPKELDIYDDNLKFAIEVNGSYWHSELNGAHPTYHLEKLIQCQEKNVSLMFIWEHLWRNKQDIIKSRIANKFRQCEKIHARACTARQISSQEKRDFLNQTHLQGDVGSSINLGLFHNESLVSVMTFGKSRFNKSAQWELLRFSSKLFFTVVGGASKLFSFFVKTYAPNSVVSYSDRQYGNGDVYSNLKFTKISSSPPAYHYTRNYVIFENRVKYQKHKLEKLLDFFDPKLTEWENMQLNGYDRIWDCGTEGWLWTNNP